MYLMCFVHSSSQREKDLEAQIETFRTANETLSKDATKFADTCYDWQAKYEKLKSQNEELHNSHEEVIKQCETSCSSNGNRMDSVSVFGCDCEQKQDLSTSPWVVPAPGGN